MDVNVIGNHIGIIGGLVFSVIFVVAISRDREGKEKIDNSRSRIKVKVNRR